MLDSDGTAAAEADEEDWENGLGAWLDDTDPEALPIGPDGRLGLAPSEEHSKVTESRIVFSLAGPL